MGRCGWASGPARGCRGVEEAVTGRGGAGDGCREVAPGGGPATGVDVVATRIDGDVVRSPIQSGGQRRGEVDGVGRRLGFWEGVGLWGVGGSPGWARWAALV